MESGQNLQVLLSDGIRRHQQKGGLMTEPGQEHIQSLLQEFSNAMLVTRTPEGQLRSRPMVIADVESNSNIWFVTSLEAPKVDEIQSAPEVCVTMQSRHKFVSFSGTAQIQQDSSRVADLWQESWQVWFPEGRDDPSLVLLKVNTFEGEYWDDSGAHGLESLIQAGKASLAGDKTDTDGKTHQKVRL